MKKLCIACALALGALSVSTAQAEEAAGTNTEAKAKFPLSVSLESDLYSAYVWRGYVNNDRPVWEPSATVSLDLFGYGALNANIWQNYDLSGQNRTGHKTAMGLSEIDYTVSYSVDIKDVSLEAGHVWYTFPKANGPDYGHSTEEIYAKAAYNNDYVTPSIAIYRDYTSGDGYFGWYMPVGLGHEFALTEKLALGVDGSLGFADRDFMNSYYGDDQRVEGGICDLAADVYLSYAVTDHLSVGAKLAWSSLLNGKARSNVDERLIDDRDIVWGGITATLSF